MQAVENEVPNPAYTLMLDGMSDTLTTSLEIV